MMHANSFSNIPYPPTRPNVSRNNMHSTHPINYKHSMYSTYDMPSAYPKNTSYSMPVSKNPPLQGMNTSPSKNVKNKMQALPHNFSKDNSSRKTNRNSSFPNKIPPSSSHSAFQSLPSPSNASSMISPTISCAEDTESRNANGEFFELFGFKIYLDDLIILAMLFFLYKEETSDPYIFIALILLLLG